MTELRTPARCVLMLAGTLAWAGACAQATPPDASSSAADRAQKQADRTLYWIRVLAEKPAAKPPAAPKAAVAAAPAARTAETRPAPAAAPLKLATSAPLVNDAGQSVVVPVGTTATAPQIPLPAAATPPAAAAALAGGVDAGVAAPAIAAGLAAPTLTPPEVDVAPAAVEEPDPGLVMTKSADPQFPMTAMRRLRKGEVEVRFEVGADGQVDVASVVRSTNPGLNSAALAAVRQWQFKPTPRGHTAVVDLAFDLDS